MIESLSFGRRVPGSPRGFGHFRESWWDWASNAATTVAAAPYVAGKYVVTDYTPLTNAQKAANLALQNAAQAQAAAIAVRARQQAALVAQVAAGAGAVPANVAGQSTLMATGLVPGSWVDEPQSAGAGAPASWLPAWAPKAAIFGIPVVLAVGFIAIAGIAFFFLRRRR